MRLADRTKGVEVSAAEQKGAILREIDNDARGGLKAK